MLRERALERALTIVDPLDGQNMADEFVKSPPNNLGLSDVKDQDPANSLIGARDTEAVRDGQTAEDVKKAEKLAAQIEKERQQQK